MPRSVRRRSNKRVRVKKVNKINQEDLEEDQVQNE